MTPHCIAWLTEVCAVRCICEPLQNKLLPKPVPMPQTTGELSQTAFDLDALIPILCMQELICSGEPLQNVLRLLVLVTLTAGGVPKKNYDVLRREVLHTYGHENILTLSRLQEAGGSILSERSALIAHDPGVLWSPAAHKQP